MQRSRSGRRPGSGRRLQRPGSAASERDHQPSQPGEALEKSDVPGPAGGTTTVIDKPPPVPDRALKPSEPQEEMAAQEEMDFPTSTEELPFPNTEQRPPSGKSRGGKRFDYDEREYDSLDPKDYGIDFNDEEAQYAPPERDDTLPDLYRLMASLESPDQQTPDKAPSLFTRPDNINSYKKITELKTEMEGSDVDDYLEKFDEGVRDDILMIGSIELEDVQEEEKRLRDEHIHYQQQEARFSADQAQSIIVREEMAKKRIAVDVKEKRKLEKRKQQLNQQRERLMLDRLNKSFRRAENQLVSVLERRKGEVKTFYGDLTLADGHYGGSKGRRWKVDWDKTPQPIQIKVKCLRGVKDKLPSGRYVLMVSLYNRLGGHVMRWSNLKGQQWGGATLPVGHDGQFYNTEMKFEQSVFTVLPSKPGIKPGMVLVYELFLLRGAVVPTDRVVGWGCFPIADGQFDIVEGKFKCPLLRGEMDPLIDKHEKIEDLMASDIDHWLSNCYFEIVKLPRYLSGQKEYEVELQFSSGILAFPDRVKTGEEYKDGEAPIPGSLEDVSLTNTSTDNSRISINSGNVLGDDDSMDKKGIPLSLDDYDADEDFKHPQMGPKPDKNDPFADLRKRRPMSTIGSRMVHKEKTVLLDSDDGSDYDDDQALLLKDDNFYPVKGQPGLFYRRHPHNPVDEYHKKIYSLLPKTPILTQKRKKRKLTHLEQLEEHNFHVRKISNEKGHLPRVGLERIQYVRRQMLAELGLSEWRSREFWGMLLMFVLAFFIRIYLHYGIQWVFLMALEIPINRFIFLPYTVTLNYQNTLLHTREEIGVVLLGPCGCLAFFILLICLSWGCQRLLKSFPDIGSKFIMAVGLQTFLDPLLIIAVDCIIGRYEDLGGDNPIADFAKLYYHFLRAEGSGLAGIFITAFLYFFTCFASGTILYMYFLRVHNNGRMLDIYWRLHGDEDVFFVPYDLELSNQELGYIGKKAEQWRGEEGERRKVAVYDYIWEEETLEETVWDENFQETTVMKEGNKEITTHVSIHSLHLDGLRELYRHFLRLPDGAIVEVFGDVAVAGMGKDIKTAISEGATTIEGITGSQATLSGSKSKGSRQSTFLGMSTVDMKKE